MALRVNGKDTGKASHRNFPHDGTTLRPQKDSHDHSRMRPQGIFIDWLSGADEEFTALVVGAQMRDQRQR